MCEVDQNRPIIDQDIKILIFNFITKFSFRYFWKPFGFLCVAKKLGQISPRDLFYLKTNKKYANSPTGTFMVSPQIHHEEIHGSNRKKNRKKQIVGFSLEISRFERNREIHAVEMRNITVKTRENFKL